MSDCVTVATLLADATTRLTTRLALDRREARIEARVLLAHALKVDHAWLIGHDRDLPTAAQLHTIETLLARRTGGEPVAYIIGEREFYGRTFAVTSETLIPRPETELMVDAALFLFPDNPACRVLDIGVGSGVVGITLALEKPGWQVKGVDVSDHALACARHNAARLNAKISFHNSDLFESLHAHPDVPQVFDLIVSNPPYIRVDDPHLLQGDLRFEPWIALAAGADGLDIIRRLIATAPNYLVSGGHLLLEHGWDQAQDIQSLLLHAGFQAVHTQLDLAGLPRITGGYMP
jgi:release factor glutamine methyltransferase